MLKKILIVLAVIIVGIVIASRFQPDGYTVERTGIITAPPPAVFAQISDFHNWEKFNPWRDLDTNMALTYEGPTSGVGAKYQWSGNSKAGKGSMTIAEMRPDEYLKVDMHFIEPMEDDAVSEFMLKPEGTGTAVTWSMSGEHNFLSRIMCLFMSMDKMIGEQYEKGFVKMNTAFAGMTVGQPSVPIGIVRDFAAPREAVWKAWTDPAVYMKWWGPNNYTCPVANLDPRTGGTFHTAIRTPDGQTFWSAGTYTDVVPMERIVYSDGFADSTGARIPGPDRGPEGAWPKEMKCTVVFAEVEGKTRMTLTYDGAPATAAENCQRGMEQSLDKLASLLAAK